MSSPQLPPHRHDDGLPRRARLRRSLLQFAAATVVVAVLALGAGWLFGRVDEPRAARLVLGEEVVTEEERQARPGPDPDVPTSGPAEPQPACGVVEEPLSPEQQVAVLAAGIVIIQYDPGLPDAELQRLRDLTDRHERLLLAPAPQLDASVVATAWRHRYEQSDVTVDPLDTFVTGYQGRSPDPRPCP